MISFLLPLGALGKRVDWGLPLLICPNICSLWGMWSLSERLHLGRFWLKPSPSVNTARAKLSPQRVWKLLVTSRLLGKRGRE